MLFARDFLNDQIILANPGNSIPLVSIILPTYHRRDTLRRAIASVLAQTFRDFELIVMDDGSTDGSDALIESFRAHDSRIIHVRHERNCGLPGLRVNEGIELARGKYLAFQFDDDYWRPNALGDLYAEAARHSEPTVVVGKANIVTPLDKKATLPAYPLDQVHLYGQNLFANNSVLMPRALVDLFGMYDCHIGMRRLCDWDLWLRYIKYVPFHTIAQVIADVFPSQAGSIGETVPWDLPLFRFWNAIPRNQLLMPRNWRDYPVDALGVGDSELSGDLRRRLYEEHLVPYYLKFRHVFPSLEGFPATLPPKRKMVLHTKGAYDVSDDVGLNHYDALTNQRGNYKAYFQPLDQVPPDWTRDADALLLIRTFEDQALTMTEQAHSEKIPFAFYLDDDVLTFHEYGEEFAYLAPGTVAHENLTEMMKHADAVWVTNRFIGESVERYNPRTIPHNGCVPQDALPKTIRPRKPERSLKIGYVGTNYRLEEFNLFLWQALQRIACEFPDRVNFEFWGLNIDALPQLDAPVIQRPFTFSYFNYLTRLQNSAFDLLLTPLLDHPRPRLGKAPSKYYQTAVAGALGIFSNVPQYEMLPENLTCLKANNTTEDWYRALRQAITMPVVEFDTMRMRALEHVRDEYTEFAQIHLHEAAWRATEFHAKTRNHRHLDGKPRVMYVLHSPNFGGGEIQLWRRLRLARAYGIEPIVVLPGILQTSDSVKPIVQSLEHERIRIEFVDYSCFTEPRSPHEFSSAVEREDVRALIQRCKPAIVHTVTFIPTFGQVCAELGVPHVASLYAIDDDFRWANDWPGFKHCALVQSDSIRYATRWGMLLETEKFCSREVAPEEVFAFGTRRHLEHIGAPVSNEKRRIRLIVTGTFQERKQQFETIQAIAQLTREGYDCELQLFGYTHFFPNYVEKCRQMIRHHHLENRVVVRGFSDDVIDELGSADCVLSLSTFESFPSAIKEAMAGGVLVVATPVGGIPELIIDGVSGILCAGTSVEAITDGIRRALSLAPAERERIVEQARRVARSEFHPQRIASDLMLMYNRAIDLTRAIQNSSSAPVVSAPPIRAIEPKQPPANSLPLDRMLTYHLNLQHSGWIGIDVLVGTHQRPASGLIVLSVLSATGKILRETSVDLACARDNGWLRFRFEPINEMVEQPLVLKFKLMNAGEQTQISLYDTSPLQPRLGRWITRWLRRVGWANPGNSLYCRMWYAI